MYGRSSRRVFLVALFLVGTSSYVDKNIIGVLLPQIKAEFRASDAMLGLLSGISFALFYATFGIPAARWADRGDRKRVITWSLIVWSMMTVLCGLSGTFWQLAAARFGVGAGEAGVMPPAQSLLADYYSPAERSGAIGIFMMSSPAGYAIGLVLGGLIAQRYGWRDAFMAAGLLGLALAPISHFALAEPRRLTRFAIQPSQRESALASLGALMSKRAYRHILGAMVLEFLMSYGALVFVVSLMMRLYRLNVAQAGTIFGVISAAGAIIGNLTGGVITDRLAARDLSSIPRVAGWGMVAAVPLYEAALASPNVLVMAALLVPSMAALNAVIPPMFSALHVVSGSRRRAMSISVAFFWANLVGVGLGPVVAGGLSDALSASYGTAEGLRGALMVVTLALAPGGWLMLRAARYFHDDSED